MAKLKTEINTPEMRTRVHKAFLAGYFLADGECIEPIFEHGQWYIVNVASGAVWSACDGEGGPAIDGFVFEEIDKGDEE